MLTYIVFIFFFSIILYGVILKKWLAGLFIVAVYALSSCCSIFLLEADRKFLEPTIAPTILYITLLFVTLKPFIREKPIIEGFSSKIEIKRFVVIGYVLSIIVIIGMIIILPRITNALNYGLVDARTAMYQGTQIEQSNMSTFMKIGSLLVQYFGSIWPFYIIMFFYAIVFIKGKIILKVLLIVASLSHVEVGLTVGGRTEALYWLLSFLFTLVFFYTYLNHKAKRIAIFSSVACMSIVFAYFAFITIQRSIFREGGAEGFVLEYVGESYLLFCEFFDKIDWHPYSIERLFPFSTYVLGFGFNLDDYRELIETHTGLNIGIFYTFMGDLFIDMGVFGLILFVLIYYRISSTLLSPKVYRIKELCYLSICYIIPLHGVFYYSLWKYGDFCILFTFFVLKYLTVNNEK